MGQAGSGKSELALNLMTWLKKANTDKFCHFFDLDMTKPLFLSWDAEEMLKDAGVQTHYQVQFMDAPTIVGGVKIMLRNPDLYTVIDVGGNHTGAAVLGGFTDELSREDTRIFYVLNGMRPWNETIEEIDETLSKILEKVHIGFGRISLINNTNNGKDTTAEDFLEITGKLRKLLSPYAEFEFHTVRSEILSEVEPKLCGPIYPIRRFLKYDWEA